jgi:hypothetical protein
MLPQKASLCQIKKLSEEQGVHHIYCTGHVIQLTARLGYLDKKYKDDDTEQLGADEDGWLRTLTKARELVNFFSHSTAVYVFNKLPKISCPVPNWKKI